MAWNWPKVLGVEVLILLSANTSLRVIGIGIELQPMPVMLGYQRMGTTNGSRIRSSSQMPDMCVLHGNSELSPS